MLRRIEIQGMSSGKHITPRGNNVVYAYKDKCKIQLKLIKVKKIDYELFCP